MKNLLILCALAALMSGCGGLRIAAVLNLLKTAKVEDLGRNHRQIIMRSKKI